MITPSDVRFVTADGVTVGWDMCAACHAHVRRCRCETGPVVPAYLSGDRAGARDSSGAADAA